MGIYDEDARCAGWRDDLATNGRVASAVKDKVQDWSATPAKPRAPLQPRLRTRPQQ